jgi:REP element-mobilizing transposase RayT
MARPLRIEYPGAVYHVMARGNQGRDIFRDDEDRLRWLKTLGESCQKTGWRVHAYVLMSNHYHLLVQTPEGNLVAGMKWLQAAYTQRYNSRHKVFGHLFQGRYKAIVVDGQDRMYLQVVSTYIHLNPARAGLIRIGEQSLNTYRWSSYPAYLKADGKATPWLQRDKVLGSLGLGEKDGKGYEAYLEGRALELASKQGRQDLEVKWREQRRGWNLGGSSFFEKLEERLAQIVKGRKRESHSGPARQGHDEAAAEQALRRGLRRLGMKEGELKEMRKGAPEKVVLAWWLREQTTVTLRWVSDRLKMGHYTRVTQALSRMRRKPAGRLKQLQRRLTSVMEKRNE